MGCCGFITNHVSNENAWDRDCIDSVANALCTPLRWAAGNGKIVVKFNGLDYEYEEHQLSNTTCKRAIYRVTGIALTIFGTLTVIPLITALTFKVVAFCLDSPSAMDWTGIKNLRILPVPLDPLVAPYAPPAPKPKVVKDVNLTFSGKEYRSEDKVLKFQVGIENVINDDAFLLRPVPIDMDDTKNRSNSEIVNSLNTVWKKVCSDFQRFGTVTNWLLGNTNVDLRNRLESEGEEFAVSCNMILDAFEKLDLNDSQDRDKAFLAIEALYDSGQVCKETLPFQASVIAQDLYEPDDFEQRMMLAIQAKKVDVVRKIEEDSGRHGGGTVEEIARRTENAALVPEPDFFGNLVWKSWVPDEMVKWYNVNVEGWSINQIRNVYPNAIQFYENGKLVWKNTFGEPQFITIEAKTGQWHTVHTAMKITKDLIGWDLTGALADSGSNPTMADELGMDITGERYFEWFKELFTYDELLETIKIKASKDYLKTAAYLYDYAEEYRKKAKALGLLGEIPEAKDIDSWTVDEIFYDVDPACPEKKYLNDVGAELIAFNLGFVDCLTKRPG